MNGTVDVAREVTEEETKALVTIEATERLVKRALRTLDGVDQSEGDLAARVEWATLLLTQAVDVTTVRTCTAVKTQALSDEISVKADDIVAREVKMARAVQTDLRRQRHAEEDAARTAKYDHPPYDYTEESTNG